MSTNPHFNKSTVIPDELRELTRDEIIETVMRMSKTDAISYGVHLGLYGLRGTSKQRIAEKIGVTIQNRKRYEAPRV